MRRPTPDPVAEGQESVWAYPRPPLVESDLRPVVITFAGEIIAESSRTHRVLETSHPPVFYIPPEDVRVELLRATGDASFCEFKGEARYYDIVVGDRESPMAGWCYPEPNPDFMAIRHAIAFYPERVDRATVGGIEVTPQPGRFYGGWVTPEIVGPFKGEPGSQGW